MKSEDQKWADDGWVLKIAFADGRPAGWPAGLLIQLMASNQHF